MKQSERPNSNKTKGGRLARFAAVVTDLAGKASLILKRFSVLSSVALRRFRCVKTQVCNITELTPITAKTQTLSHLHGIRFNLLVV